MVDVDVDVNVGGGGGSSESMPSIADQRQFKNEGGGKVEILLRMPRAKVGTRDAWADERIAIIDLPDQVPLNFVVDAIRHDLAGVAYE